MYFTIQSLVMKLHSVFIFLPWHIIKNEIFLICSFWGKYYCIYRGLHCLGTETIELNGPCNVFPAYLVISQGFWILGKSENRNLSTNWIKWKHDRACKYLVHKQVAEYERNTNLVWGLACRYFVPDVSSGYVSSVNLVFLVYLCSWRHQIWHMCIWLMTLTELRWLSGSLKE